MSIDTVQVEECITLQQEEQEVMQSIDPDSVTFSGPSLTGTQVQLRVSVDLEGPRQALVTTVDGVLASDSPHRLPLKDDTQSSSSSFAAEVTLSHLPPIDLVLLLPPGYPLYESAAIISLHATHSWITSASIDKLWACISDITREGVENGGEGILWRVYELLRDSHVLSMLDLCDGPRLCIPHHTPQFLVPLLLSHNTSATSENFEKQSYPCPICLTTVPGSKCTRIDKCGHVCCKSCLSDFWTLSIQQGEVERVSCVNESCVKTSAKNANDPLWTSVGEDQVRQVVGETLLRRWMHLREKRMIEREPTTVRCPNRSCQGPVPRPPLAHEAGDEEYSNWDNLRCCPGCDFSFCLACRKTWHGPLIACSSVNDELIQSYLSAEPKSEERLRIEKQYGKKLIDRLVIEYEEARQNKEWMEANTMHCPGCTTKVEKSADEMREVLRTLLLPMWPEAPRGEPIYPFFNERNAVLRKSLLTRRD
ncbi:translation termination inhibitor protein itt1 [Tulasnella sp. JGI-2019a]|nr:translation termination inhibitor protein itt1 [Tulasnella sp. JGI-2019a]